MSYNQYNDRGGNYSQRGGGRGSGFQQQINGGSMFQRDKSSPKSPDMGGDLVLGGELLDYILREAQRGEVKIEISGWRRLSRNNTSYISLQVQTPWEVRKGEQNPGYRPQRNYGQQQQRNDYRDNNQRDERNPPPNQGYAEQSGRDDRSYGNSPQSSGRYRTDRNVQRDQGMSDEEFAKGDSMPDFMRDPNEPPF